MFARSRWLQMSFLGLMVGVFLWVFSFGQGAASVPGKSFCQPKVVHDYSRPFQNMPKLKEPPASGQLKFAPPETVFSALSSPVVLARKEGMRFGYGFESVLNRTFHLNWEIEGKISLVSAEGKVLKTVTSKHWAIGTVTEAELNDIRLMFGLDNGKRFYRVDLVFRKRGGEMLGRYAQYLRVVKTTVRPKLGAQQDKIKVTEPLVFRVENFGTAPIRYGEPFSIERFSDGMWRAYPAELGPWRRLLRSIRGGSSGPCQEWIAPAITPSGLYRIRKVLAQPQKGVTATFQVIP